MEEDWAKRAAEQDWPDGLLERAIELRMPSHEIEYWLDNPHPGADERRVQHLDDRQRLMEGTLRARVATWADDEAVADLYANATEQVDDWDVVTERSPNPYAQYRLQENAYIRIIEDRGLVLTASGSAGRNTIIEGQECTASCRGAWRVRDGQRGQGFSRMLQWTPGPFAATFSFVNYWYERSGNQPKGWLDKVRSELEERELDVEKPELSATVHQLEPQRYGGSAEIRAVEADNLDRSIDLINRTHDGLDLFRAYTRDFLRGRLDDPSWGPKPPFWADVYTWGDMFVLEEEGAIVACGGLWDRGRDVREVWTHRESGERHVVDTTSLMDWGYAEGRADAMAELIRFHAGQTAELGRRQFLVPLEFAPDVLALVGGDSVASETRALQQVRFDEGGVTIDATITQPYTDLAYW